MLTLRIDISVYPVSQSTFLILNSYIVTLVTIAQFFRSIATPWRASDLVSYGTDHKNHKLCSLMTWLSKVSVMGDDVRWYTNIYQCVLTFCSLRRQVKRTIQLPPMHLKMQVNVLSPFHKWYLFIVTLTYKHLRHAIYFTRQRR